MCYIVCMVNVIIFILKSEFFLYVLFFFEINFVKYIVVFFFFLDYNDIFFIFMINLKYL